MEELKFNSTYHFADLVEAYILGGSGFWNYSEEEFIEKATGFKKETLLHHYIETTIWNYYNREFRKWGGVYEDNEDFLEFLKGLFVTYKITIVFFDKIVNIEEAEDLHKDFLSWWYSNEIVFRELFKKIANDVFYLFFNHRELLFNFNKIVAETVEAIDFSKRELTKSGKLRRKNIPQWVKKAVFLRDKGRCAKCSKDLTGLIATDSQQHYDHIIPLNKFGANDPSNIQLLCERCNRTKSDKIVSISKSYSPWWKY